MSNYKVLSIDLDIIFEPCISLYSGDINDAPKGRLWDMLYHIKDIERHLSINDSIFNCLSTHLQNLFNYKNIKEIHVGENHSSIINMCSSIYKKGDTFNITNIDHHHDICYNPRQKEDAYRYNTCNCGSWLIYLESKNVVSQYTWLKNYNSIDYDGEPLSILYMQDYFEGLLDILPELLNDIDYLYITTSDKYCPPRFYPLLQTIIGNLNHPNIIYHGYEISHPDNAPIDYFK